MNQPLVTKYPWALALANRLVPEKGRRIRVHSPVETVTGQQLEDNQTVYADYYIDAYISESLLSRAGGYQRSDRGRCLIPATKNRPPRPGDVLTMANGRQFIVDTALAKEPDSVPIYYDVSVSDG